MVETQLGIDWNGLSEAFEIPEERLKEVQEEGTTCSECGEHLANLGVAIRHSH